MFEGFERRIFQRDGCETVARIGGAGDPMLLLHGYPLTHACWHSVAAILKDRFTLVIPDLVGYGESTGPAPDAAHENYSKRTMAKHYANIMDSLGFEKFHCVGHDRGGRVAYRMALDFPSRVRRLVLLDVATTLDTWAAMDMQFSLDAYHWPLLAQPSPLPETLIGSNATFYLNHLIERWKGKDAELDPVALEHYTKAFNRKSVLTATFEDYRAGATVDYRDDLADREAGRKIACPIGVIWGKQYLSASPKAAWTDWCETVDDICLDCGHFMFEEKPQECAEAIAHLVGDRGPASSDPPDEGRDAERGD